MPLVASGYAFQPQLETGLSCDVIRLGWPQDVAGRMDYPNYYHGQADRRLLHKQIRAMNRWNEFGSKAGREKISGIIRKFANRRGFACGHFQYGESVGSMINVPGTLSYFRYVSFLVLDMRGPYPYQDQLRSCIPDLNRLLDERGHAVKNYRIPIPLQLKP